MDFTYLLPLYTLLCFFGNTHSDVTAELFSHDINIVKTVTKVEDKKESAKSDKIPDGFFTEPKQVDLEGSYSWQLIFDYSNYNNTEIITKTIRITHVTISSYNTLEKNVQEFVSNKHIDGGLDASGIFDILNVNVKGSYDSKLSSTFDNLVERKKEETVTVEDTGIFPIGPNSRFTLYQLMFHGGGVAMSTGITASETKPIPNVTISCQVRQQLFIKNIDVVFTAQSVERPTNLISETNGGDADINYRFGLDYSWLVPLWTTSKKEAVTSIVLIYQNQENKEYKDLTNSKGTYGYRYLKMLTDPNSLSRIVKVGLVRAPFDSINEIKPSDYRWDACTSDINTERSSGGSSWHDDLALYNEGSRSVTLEGICKKVLHSDRLFLCWNWKQA